MLFSIELVNLVKVFEFMMEYQKQDYIVIQKDQVYLCGKKVQEYIKYFLYKKERIV